MWKLGAILMVNLERLDEQMQRWHRCWEEAHRLLVGVSPAERLDRALAAYIAAELEEAPNDQPKTTTIGLCLAAVTRAQTHSKEAVTAAVERLRTQPSKDTFKLWRVAIVTSGIWIGCVVLWQFVFGDSYSRDKAAAIAIGMPALVTFSTIAWRWAVKPR